MVVIGIVVGVAVYGCCGRCRSPIDGREGTQRIDGGGTVGLGLGSQHGRGGGFNGAWRRRGPVNWESSGVFGDSVVVGGGGSGGGGGGRGGCR